MNLSDDDKKWFETVIDAHVGRLSAYSPAWPEPQRVAPAAVKTRLPVEFRRSASPTDLRVSSHADAILALELELENIKARLSKLEPKQ
jgi:hypothetical protein